MMPPLDFANLFYLTSAVTKNGSTLLQKQINLQMKNLKKLQQN
jgi:hypothetical protein